MDAVKICTFLLFVISDVITFHVIDQLEVLPASERSHRKKNQVRLQQADVYNGVKSVLRQLFPGADGEGTDGMGAETDGDTDQDDAKPVTEDCSDECEPDPTERPSEKLSSKTKKPGKSNGKGSKYTNVNFVLYNSGIKFHKADDAVNKQQLAKLRFNCILVVASANKCYGWDSNKKNDTKTNGPDGMEMFQKDIVPAILPFLTGNSSTGGGGMDLNDFIYPPSEGNNNLSPTFRRTKFHEIMDEMHEPSDQVTIFI